MKPMSLNQLCHCWRQTALAGQTGQGRPADPMSSLPELVRPDQLLFQGLILEGTSLSLGLPGSGVGVGSGKCSLFLHNLHREYTSRVSSPPSKNIYPCPAPPAQRWLSHWPMVFRAKLSHRERHRPVWTLQSRRRLWARRDGVVFLRSRA